MIDASIVRRMQAKRADELHMKLCAKIEQAIINAARDSFTELIVKLHTAMQLPPNAHPPEIYLEAYAYDIERLQFALKMADYKVENTANNNIFRIKW